RTRGRFRPRGGGRVPRPRLGSRLDAVGFRRAFGDPAAIDSAHGLRRRGFGPRDNAPEATIAVADRVVPGIPEEMRRKGLEKTPLAVLSRAAAAARGKVLIVNLPGSPKGATESLEAVAHLLPHAIRVLHGARHD